MTSIAPLASSIKFSHFLIVAATFHSNQKCKITVQTANHGLVEKLKVKNNSYAEFFETS